MDFVIGLTGLPNVGKSVIFHTVTGAETTMSPHPFSTPKPVEKVVALQDSRLKEIASIISPRQLFPVMVKWIDMAGIDRISDVAKGLVAENLGVLSSTDVIGHVVRFFTDDSVPYKYNSFDIRRDISEVNSMLCQNDLELIRNRVRKVEKMIHFGQKEMSQELNVLERANSWLSSNRSLNEENWNSDEFRVFETLNLISHKPMFFIINCGETEINDSKEEHFSSDITQIDNFRVIWLCGKLESEILDLAEDEQSQFLKVYGNYTLKSPNIVWEALHCANRIFYFTFGNLGLKEWIIEKGTKVVSAAKRLHTDFAKGFVTAEVMNVEELIQCGSIDTARKNGVMRLEGKDYVINDGDILYFRFTV
jgi:GTP-binding protein YchF